MNRKSRVMIPIMALCLIALCGITVKLVAQIQSYSKLVNYVGIVRGATQRLVKLEISGIPGDSIQTYLDDILQELDTGEGDIGLVQIDDAVYNQGLQQLRAMWSEIKEDISNVRQGAPKTELLSRSEAYFDLANETVFAAEIYSNHQTTLLLLLILALVAVMVLTWSFILWSYVKQLLHLENTNQHLSDVAYTDVLTGAPNYEKFKLQAEELIKKNPTSQFAVFNIDIDNFKYYNDVFGMQYGDEILKKYADALAESMGSSDTFCRMNADAFLVLRCYKNKVELIRQQEDVDKEIVRFVQETKDQRAFSLSIGICCMDDLTDDHPIESVIEQANFARKTIKNQALTHYAFYDESIRHKMFSEKELENRIYSALGNREFVVFMQPKVDLKTDKIACVEALVRWITKDGTLVLPDDFIPAFEKSQSIAFLDQYVMEEVCKWIHHRLKEAKAALPVSVNVSCMQLYDPDFVKTYTAIKNKYRIPTGMLEIEFTESMAFENTARFLEIVAELKQEGFYCSLDDFGKGYSSLNLLRNLPVDVLKMDKLFFEEDGQQEKARLIIAGIVSLVKKLGITIVAEGIEREDQVIFLREIGCDMVQGYVFYRPMSISALERLMEDHALSCL